MHPPFRAGADRTRRIAGGACWRASGRWQFNGFGTWAVERKSDGKLVGNVGLFTAWRDMEPEFGEEPEMGWILARRDARAGAGVGSLRAPCSTGPRRTSKPTPIVGDHRAGERAVDHAGREARLRAAAGKPSTDD